MTLPLLKVEDHDTQFNFDQIAQRFLDAGGRQAKLRFGTTAINIVAGNNGAATVTHGMGSTPVAVLCTTDQLNWFASADTVGATTFRTQIREYQATAATLTVNVYWAALG